MNPPSSVLHPLQHGHNKTPVVQGGLLWHASSLPVTACKMMHRLGCGVSLLVRIVRSRVIYNKEYAPPRNWGCQCCWSFSFPPILIFSSSAFSHSFLCLSPHPQLDFSIPAYFCFSLLSSSQLSQKAGNTRKHAFSSISSR